MEKRSSLIFYLKERSLIYDFLEGILLFRRSGDKKNLWIKKIYERSSLEAVVEDEERLYLSFADSEREGQFLVLERDTGRSVWNIPGRPFFHQIYGEYIFLIFLDKKGLFYLLKVRKKDGGKLWHHAVREDLCEYVIKMETLSLKYKDGHREELSMDTGKLLS